MSLVTSHICVEYTAQVSQLLQQQQQQQAAATVNKGRLMQVVLQSTSVSNTMPRSALAAAAAQGVQDSEQRSQHASTFIRAELQVYYIVSSAMR
jgi:hypothetical protein